MGDARWIDYWVVDVYTHEPFRGNPAGVVLDAGDLDSSRRAAVARELGGWETAFVLPPSYPDADLAIRWYTANCELPFSVHATLAALHVLTESGRYSEPTQLAVETLSGLRAAWLTYHEGEMRPFVQVPLPQLETAPLAREAVCEALLVSREVLAEELPLAQDGMSLLVPFRRRASLFELSPDLRKLSRLGLEADITSFICFSDEPDDEGSQWHIRYFAPGLGIAEDPVTGTAHAAVGAYLLAHGRLPASGAEVTCWGAQGDCLERHGRVQLHLALNAQHQPAQARIGGTAVTVLCGRLRVE
ncbi:MAG: PhzF family phenazine biosynthesis protein [Chloroflexia bacterium]